jgi:processing peptidase subunit alpha
MVGSLVLVGLDPRFLVVWGWALRGLLCWTVRDCGCVFNSVYNDTGLFGIHATSSGPFVPKLVDLVCEEFTAVATSGQVSEAELQRAKNATVSAVLMNLESRVVVTEDIGRQILTYGHRKPVAEFLEGIQALTLKDVSEVAQKIISTPLTMASWGDVVQVPRFDAVANRF